MMTCTDSSLRARSVEAQRKVFEFWHLLTSAPLDGQSAEEMRQRLEGIVGPGIAIADEFNSSITAFLDRGTELYRLRDGLRFRWSAWRAKRRRTDDQAHAAPMM
jgi:hypothetical protein